MLTAALAAAATAPGPLALAAVEVNAWAWVPGFVPLFTLVPLLYPDGRLPSRRWWPAAVLAIAGTVLLTIAVALYPEPFRGSIEIAKPWTAKAVAEPLGPVAGLLLVTAALAAVASLAVRWRRSGPLARRQIAVLAGAVGVLVLQLLVQPALPVAARGISRPAPSRSSLWRWVSPSPGTGSSTSTSPCPGPCSRRAWPRASRGPT